LIEDEGVPSYNKTYSNRKLTDGTARLYLDTAFIGGAIQFAGSTPLNVYLEQTVSLQATGPLSATVSMRFVCLGRMVVATCDGLRAKGNGEESSLRLGVIPQGLRPPHDIGFPVVIRDTNRSYVHYNEYGRALIKTDGTVTIGISTESAPYQGTSQDIGFDAWTALWVTN
jgi:hypothetical protein